VEGGFLTLQVGDQFLRTIDRDLVQDGSLNLAIAIYRPVNLYALLTHRRLLWTGTLLGHQRQCDGQQIVPRMSWSASTSR
jgi:hypothetical protein